MADVACNGSPCGTCNGLKHNVCASVAKEHRVFGFVGTHFEVTAVYAEHLMIPGGRCYCRYFIHQPRSDRARTKGTNSIQPIRILDAVQLYALIMPRPPFPLLPEFLLSGPRNIRNDVCDEPRPLPIPSEEPHGGVLCIQFFEHGEEERVWIGGERFWDVFLVEHIVKKGGKLNHKEIGRARGNQWIGGQS